MGSESEIRIRGAETPGERMFAMKCIEKYIAESLRAPGPGHAPRYFCGVGFEDEPTLEVTVWRGKKSVLSYVSRSIGQ